MNPRQSSFRIVLVAAIVAIAVIVWMCVGLGRGASRAIDSAEEAVMSQSRKSVDEGANHEAMSKPVGIPELALKFSPEEYIKGASNKTAALAALFAYTHDPDYLDALKQRALTDRDAAVLAVNLMIQQQDKKRHSGRVPEQA